VNLPKILQGEARKGLLRGAAVGALVTVVIGFGWGDWTLGRTADRMADQRAKGAVVAALAPICVDKFQHATEAKATLAKLKTIDSWQQDRFVVEGGWATFPGSSEPSRDVAEACAKLLGEMK